MKIFEELNLTAFAQKYKFLSTIQAIEGYFKTIEEPDLDGIPIKSFGDKNLADVGEGNVVINVDTLESPVSIGGEVEPVFLRHSPTERKLEYSNDGIIWGIVGEAGAPPAIPEEVANPVKIGSILLFDWGPGSLRVSYDEGVNYTPLLTTAEGIIPEEIANPVILGTLQLRDNVGELEKSEDDGNTWESVGGGSGSVVASSQLAVISDHAGIFFKSEFELWANNPLSAIKDWSIFTHDITGKGYSEGAGAQISTDQSKFGTKSLSFANGFLGIEDPPLINMEKADFTFACWIYPTDLTDRNVVFSCGYLSSDEGAWSLEIGQGTIGVTIRDEGTLPDYHFNGTFAEDAWGHFAITKVSNTFYIFWNGGLIAAQGMPDKPLGEYPCYIGHAQTYAYAPVDFLGYMDDIVLLKGQALWTESFTAPADRLQEEFKQTGELYLVPGSADMYLRDSGTHLITKL